MGVKDSIDRDSYSEHSRIMLRNIIDSSPDAISVIDMNGKVTDCNLASLRLLGYSERKELVGKTAYDIIAPADLERVRKNIQLSFEKGITRNIEYSVVRKDGRLIAVEVSAGVIKDHMGNPFALVATAKDITERKSAESALRENEEKYRRLFEVESDALFLIERDSGRIHDANKAALEIYGYSLQEFLSMRNYDLSTEPEKTRKATLKDLPRVPLRLHRKKDGTVFPVEIKARSFLLKGKKMHLAAIRDVTERFRSEESMRRRLELEKALSNISSFFVRAENFDDAVNLSLKEIGLVTGADRAYTFRFMRGRTIMENTHEWCASGVSPQIENLKGLETKMFPWWMKRITHGDIIQVKDVSKLPSEAKAEKEILESQDIKSIIVFPLKVKGSISGFIGLDNTKANHGERSDDLVMLRLSSEIIGSAVERHVAENEVQSSRDQLRSIINSASELIFSVNNDGLVTEWNSSIASKTGCSQKDMLERNIFSNSLPSRCSAFFDLARESLETRKASFLEHEIRDNNGNVSIVLSNVSFIKGKDNSIEGIVVISRDITDQRDIYKRLEYGNSYISTSDDFNDILTMIVNLKEKQPPLLLVSRGDMEKISRRLPQNSHIILLSEHKIRGVDTESDPENLIKSVSRFISKNNNAIILMGKLNYISSLYGFNELLKYIYRMNDLVRSSRSMAIVHVPEGSFENREYSLLKEDFNVFPERRKEGINLEAKKREILNYVGVKDAAHSMVNFNMISKEFQISRITTRAWLKELQAKGLVKISKKGNLKQVNITEKGKGVVLPKTE